MSRKIPPDAFDHYVSLGPGRSYAAVAAKCGVTKRAITRLATKDGWQERLASLERQAREQSDSRIVETLEAMNARHLKILRFIQARALEALRKMPITDAVAAARALDMSIRQERTVQGEPADRSAIDVHQVIRSEYERWMKGGADEDPAA